MLQTEFFSHAYLFRNLPYYSLYLGPSFAEIVLLATKIQGWLSCLPGYCES